MPVESAQYINTLQPDWPLGTDPESAGDDHLRMIKQVLKNTFPSLSGEVKGTPEQLNELTSCMTWTKTADSTTDRGFWTARDVDRGDNTAALMRVQTATLAEFQDDNYLALNFNYIKNQLYPVGSIVIYADNVNPATRLGVGTWTAVTGMIAGAGSVPDKHGLSYAVKGGDGHGEGTWRIQDTQIVEVTKSLSNGKTSENGGHSHTTQMHLGGVGSTNDGSTHYASTGAGNADGSPLPSSSAADHEHTVTGSISMGSGTSTSGEVAVNPYYGLYVWRRTA